MGALGSLESARTALEAANAEVTSLLAQTDRSRAAAELAAAFAARARVWRTVARLSFDDVVASDLLSQAAEQAACHDELLAEQHRGVAPGAHRGP